MLLFWSEAEIQAWVDDTGEPRGEILTLAQVWALSQAWYHSRVDPNFRGRSLEEVRTIFGELGLTSQFWQPPA